MTEDEILIKIRKVLAKAENQAATKEESESYFAMAAKLIAKYGVDEALLAAASPEKNVVGDKRIVLHAPYVQDKAGLLNAVATPLRVKAVLVTDRLTKVKTMHLFGFQSDLDRVEILYTSLLIQRAQALLIAELFDLSPGESTKAFRCSFQAGFSSAVRNRLEEAESDAVAQASKESGHSVALVIIDRTEAVQRKMEEVYPRLRQQTRSLRGTGRDSGYAAGQKANIGSKSVHGSRAGIGA